MRSTDLVNEVSHALRQPLVQAVEEAETAHSLKAVLDVSTLQQLLGMVDHLVEFAQIVAAGLAFDAVDIAAPLNAALEQTRAAYPHISFHKQWSSAWGHMDSQLITRVAELLLRQVIESQPGEMSHVFMLTSADHVQNELVVSIGDEGSNPDIAEATPLAPSSLTAESSVALFLCAQIVEMQHGQLWMSQATRPCVNFHFSLPAFGFREE
jgi:signal transduction histidine kinase